MKERIINAKPWGEAKGEGAKERWKKKIPEDGRREVEKEEEVRAQIVGNLWLLFKGLQ